MYPFRFHTYRRITLLALLSSPFGHTTLGGELPQNDTTTLRTGHSIERVVVTASRPESAIPFTPMSVKRIERSQIEERLRTSLLPTLSEEVPGLFSTARGVMGYGVSSGAAGALSLRGIGGEPTTGLLLVVDGEPQYMGLMGHPIADLINQSQVERVEVVRGPASVLYGSNAMGGVVHLTTRQHRQAGSSVQIRGGYGSYNSLEGSLEGGVRKGRFSLSLGGLGRYSEGHRPNMEFCQYGASLRLALDLSARWRLAAQGEFSHIESANPGSITSPILDNDASIIRYRSSLRLTHSHPTCSGALTLFGGWGRHHINDGYSPGQEPLDYRFHSRDYLAGATLCEQIHLRNFGRLTLGADYYRVGGETRNHHLDTGWKEVTADVEQEEVAAYAALRLQLCPWLVVDGGIRLDHHSHVGSEWVGQGALSLQLAPQAELKLLASKGFRFPTIREMYLFPSQNPDLRPERLWSYEVAFTHRLGRLSYGVNLFYLNGDNQIRTIIRGGRPHNENTGRVENWGLEAEVEAPLGGHFRLSANYSWLYMRYPTTAAPTHKLYLAGSFEKGRWRIQSGLHYIAGLYTQLPEPATEAHTEEFMLWNLRLTLRLNRHLRLWARGENLLAVRYEINEGFPMPRATVMAGCEFDF